MELIRTANMAKMKFLPIPNSYKYTKHSLLLQYSSTDLIDCNIN